MEEQKVHELLKSILVEENMQNATIDITNANVAIKDGYMSEILRVVITKNSKQLHLIIKVAPTDPHFRDIVKLFYMSEIHFYEEIFPHFNNLQLKYTGKPITFVPKLYKAVSEHCNETIVIENLTPKGFIMLDGSFVLPEEIMHMTLKELGKFHALSFALQKENKAVWDTLENHVNPADIFKSDHMDLFLAALKKATIFFTPINKSIAAKFKHIHDNFESVMGRLLVPSKKYPSLMCHLDTWCNNLLYKYADKVDKSSTQPKLEDVVMIDYQQVTKGSPVLDISCFLYINGGFDSITNWREMLKVYYNSLFNHAKVLNCPIDYIYSWEMFLDDWKDYCLYGYIKSIMGISLNPEEPTETVKGQQIGNVLYVEQWKEKTNERIIALGVHMENEGFL